MKRARSSFSRIATVSRPSGLLANTCSASRMTISSIQQIRNMDDGCWKVRTEMPNTCAGKLTAKPSSPTVMWRALSANS